MGKNDKYACQKVVVTYWKHGNIIMRGLLIYLFFNFYKKYNATKSFGRNSSRCGAVVAGSSCKWVITVKTHACYVTQFTYKS